MYDGLFLINSAVCAPEGTRWSVFDNKTRFEQTLETLDSIDRICPNNVKVIFDCSPVEIPEEWMKTISERPNTWFLDMGKHPIVQMYSMHGLRSHAESYAMTGALAWLETQKFESKRIYKLSGRYCITDDFILDDPSYKDSFVFLESHPTWMTLEEQNHAGVDRVYDLRLWHMDSSVLESFKKELLSIIGDICNLGIDVEHAYYKHLHNYKVVELPRIGVTGYMAPTGELINE